MVESIRTPFNMTKAENSDKYYVEKPELVVQMVKRSLNNSKRKLSSCETGNPIDDCWRCDPNWVNNRKRLADCAIGFGKNAIGGKNGRYYIVTDPNDDDPVNPRPGTLRHAVIQTEPLWIIFQRDMYVINIIIHGVHIHDCKPAGNTNVRSSPTHYGFRTKSDGDGISIFGSSAIWVDHCSLSSCADGLIDAIMGSTAITISNSFFTHHDKVMLLGHTDAYTKDVKMQVTVAFNHFGEGLVQHMPRCRHGYFHATDSLLLTIYSTRRLQSTKIQMKASGDQWEILSSSGVLTCRKGSSC
ncbi:hypothetical protein SUGI_0304340 [Cryptomeria japonica]|nr:hypothetical protein SUGI_0304340 [Cryptomeria japonica]